MVRLLHLELLEETLPTSRNRRRNYALGSQKGKRKSELKLPLFAPLKVPSIPKRKRNKTMIQTPTEVVRQFLASTTNPTIVKSLVAEDATYVSLNYDNPDLKKIKIGRAHV